MLLLCIAQEIIAIKDISHHPPFHGPILSGTFAGPNSEVRASFMLVLTTAEN